MLAHGTGRGGGLAVPAAADAGDGAADVGELGGGGRREAGQVELRLIGAGRCVSHAAGLYQREQGAASLRQEPRVAATRIAG